MTDALMSRTGRVPVPAGRAEGGLNGRIVPVLIVTLVLVLVWYAAAVVLNVDLQRDAFANAGRTDTTVSDLVVGTWSQERPGYPRRTRSSPSSIAASSASRRRPSAVSSTTRW